MSGNCKYWTFSVFHIFEIYFIQNVNANHLHFEINFFRQVFSCNHISNDIARGFLRIIWETLRKILRKVNWRWMFDAILFYFGTGRYIFQNERFWFCCQHKFQINREFKGNLFNKNIVRKRMNYKIFINHMEMKYLKLLKLKTSK